MNPKNLPNRLKNELRVIKNTSLKHEISSYKIDQHYINIRRHIALLKHGNKVDIACVIHLYYIESWDFLKEKLSQIKTFKYDLFISLPTHNIKFKEQILKDFPSAFVYETPNRGRDVLPFISIAEVLSMSRYSSVLKIHSKKSTHRTDGGDWFRDMVNSLIPKDESLQKNILRTLSFKDTAVIGPKDQYTSLTVNFDANGTHMTKIVSKIYSKKTAHKSLQVDRSEYGFFAGTMFWLKLDSVKPLLKLINARNFESEAGQIDATYAHALERLLCVIPEIESKGIYELKDDSIEPVTYNSGVIPDWSKVYIGPKAD